MPKLKINKGCFLVLLLIASSLVINPIFNRKYIRADSARYVIPILILCYIGVGAVFAALYKLTKKSALVSLLFVLGVGLYSTAIVDKWEIKELKANEYNSDFLTSVQILKEDDRANREIYFVFTPPDPSDPRVGMGRKDSERLTTLLRLENIQYTHIYNKKFVEFHTNLSNEKATILLLQEPDESLEKDSGLEIVHQFTKEKSKIVVLRTQNEY